MSYKSIINTIKGVAKNPDLESLIRKEIPKIKAYATVKHKNIMSAVENNIITEEIGKTQMNDIYSEIDDKITVMIENTDKMLEFLENIKEHHDEIDLDNDMVKKYIFKETLKYQRLSAEVIALSFYVDTLFEEFGLLDDLDGMEEYGEYDDDDLDDENEEDSEDSDNDDDYVPEMYESELTFRDRLFGAKTISLQDPIKYGECTIYIIYTVSEYSSVFAIRCLKDGTFEYGYANTKPSMINKCGSWSKLDMDGFIGIMKTKCPNNPFYKWYTSEDGYQKYLKEWTETTEKSKPTFADKLCAATDFKLVETTFENGIDAVVEYSTNDYTGSFALRLLKTGSAEYGYSVLAPKMISVVGYWTRIGMSRLIDLMKTDYPDNPFYKWYTSEDGYQKYVKEWSKTAEDSEDDKEPEVCESGLTFKDKLFAATSYELNDEVFKDGVDLCINFDYPVSGDAGSIALRCCFEDESFAYGYLAPAPFMINVVDSWTKADMDALISEMKVKCPNNPVLSWFTRSDGYDKYKIEWMRAKASTKHAEK